MFQSDNDPKGSRAKPDSFTDCEDITAMQITHALHENKVKVDHDVTDCEFAEINSNKPTQGELIQDEKELIILDGYKKDKQPFEDIASEDLPIQIKEVEKVVPNNIKHVKTTFDEVISPLTVAIQSESIKSEDIPNIIPTDKTNKIKSNDVDDNYFDASQVINKDQREKPNVSLVVASNADDECPVDCKVTNEQDITPTQIIPALLEKKVKVEDDITDCEFAKMNTNKPPQGELIQDEKAEQVIILDSYKKDKQPFEDMPADNVTSEYLPIPIKVDETVVPNNNIKHVKNTFDEVVSQFTKALQSPVRVKSEDIPNIPNVQNEQDGNENTYCGINLSSQKNMEVLSGNDATLKNVSDSSDEESPTPKNCKRFTFTDSDLPSDSEITDILMAYPKPTVVESSQSESESSSEDEPYEFLSRRMNKTEPVPKIDLTRMIGIEKLPSRVMTRLRKLKPSYLTEQEAQMDEDIILENMERLKSCKKANKKNGNKSNEHKRKVKVKIEKPEKKGKISETKSFAGKNTKEDSLKLNFVSAAKTTTKTSTQKPDHIRKPFKKERSIFTEIEERRSRRQQKPKEENDDTIKAPISSPKKSKPKQNIYNVSSSSSKSPRSLKRLLIDDSDMPSPKRTRSHNNINNNSINNTSLRATPARVLKTQYGHLSTFPDPYVLLVRCEPAQTRIRTLNSNQALRRVHRACVSVCEPGRQLARTSTMRL